LKKELAGFKSILYLSVRHDLKQPTSYPTPLQIHQGQDGYILGN